jgi:15-cis-phytoene synthase
VREPSPLQGRALGEGAISFDSPSPNLSSEGERDRRTLVAFARDSIARGSKSFAAASRLFDRQTRERVWLLYAWCRKCDDMADGQDHGGAMAQVTDPAARLAAIRGLTAKAIRGEPTGEPAFDALGIVAAECGLTQKMADDVIDGFALDTADWRPRSEDDLYRYCFHVAGAVGVMMAVVMGVSADDDATLDRACDLGLAFQLANIARDLNEDDAAGRCYLPQDWLSDMDIPPGQTLSPHYRDRLASLAKRMCDASERYEASARVGAASLPFRSRWAVLAAAGIYGDIARQVRSKGAHAWDQRVYTSKADKLAWVAKAGVMAVRNMPEMVTREGLWTRDK